MFAESSQEKEASCTHEGEIIKSRRILLFDWNKWL